MCANYCEFGKVADANGCLTCECFDPCKVSASPRTVRVFPFGPRWYGSLNILTLCPGNRMTSIHIVMCAIHLNGTHICPDLRDINKEVSLNILFIWTQTNENRYIDIFCEDRFHIGVFGLCVRCSVKVWLYKRLLDQLTVKTLFPKRWMRCYLN